MPKWYHALKVLFVYSQLNILTFDYHFGIIFESLLGEIHMISKPYVLTFISILCLVILSHSAWAGDSKPSMSKYRANGQRGPIEFHLVQTTQNPTHAKNHFAKAIQESDNSDLKASISDNKFDATK
jgi:hypothetical protein